MARELVDVIDGDGLNLSGSALVINKDGALCCPFCKAEQAHPVGIKIHWANFDAGEAGMLAPTILINAYGKIEMGKDDRPGTRSRGLSYTLFFDGECGHCWEIDFFFHKGDTQVAIRVENASNNKELVYRDKIPGGFDDVKWH